MHAIRKAILSLGITLFGLTIGFVIMAYEMPGVYPGLSDVKAFLDEKFSEDAKPELTPLQALRERNPALPVSPQGMAEPIGGGNSYGILDVFRMKQIFRPNDAVKEPLRTVPGQDRNGAPLPTIGETRKSSNVLSGTL